MKNMHSETDTMRLDRLEQILVAASQTNVGTPMAQNNITHKIMDCSECGIIFKMQEQWNDHMKNHNVTEIEVLESTNPDILLVDSQEEKNESEYENSNSEEILQAIEDVSYDILYQPEKFSEEKKIYIKLYDDSEDFDQALNKLEGLIKKDSINNFEGCESKSRKTLKQENLQDLKLALNP